MSDRDLIERFNQDVEQVLQTGIMTDSVDPSTAEYAGSLLVVRMLSSIDFSKESKERYTIRQRLLAAIDTRESRSQKVKENIFMNTVFQKHRAKLAFSMIILVGFLGMLFANLIWPGSIVAAAQNVVSLVNRLWVSEHTFISPINLDQIIELEDGSLAMQGEYIGESESAGKESLPAGKSVTFEIRKFENLAEAQAVLPFELAQPSYLPKAYVFQHIKVFGEGDLASANMLYAGPDGDLLFSQRQVGDQTVSIGLPEDYIVEKVKVNGFPAIWSEHVLMWEAVGVSYLLSSPNLSLADAIRIAESLK